MSKIKILVNLQILPPTKQMQSQDSVQLHSSSDEENNTTSPHVITPSVNGQPQDKTALMKEEEQDSSLDSEIGDFEQERLQSEGESDDKSIFEYEDEVIDEEDKQSGSSSEQEIGEIFDQENENQNTLHDEDQMETESPPLKSIIDGPQTKVALRDYQKTLFQKSQDRNSIIYLPTGLGKTRIAIASMYYYLSYTQKKKVVFLANTVQLVKQQAEAIKKTLHGIIQNKSLCKELNKKHDGNDVHLDWTWERICREVVCIHGEKNDEIGQTKKKKIQSSLMSKKEFLRKFQNSTVIVVISQMFLNCLRRGFIKLTDFSFIVFDQCHHCQGDHPYAGIMNEFYFDLKKKLEKQKKLQRNLSLPKIMGLTASPIPNPQKNEKRLQKMIEQLCISMDSNFVEYPNNESGNETRIEIVEIKETEQKYDNPYLLTFFEKNTSHREAYEKIQYYFPLYFSCVSEVIKLMESRYDCLKLNRSVSEIHQPELFFFYDIKECLLKKLKDLWLQLGEYVMCFALGDMITQLNNITGIKDQSNQQLLKDIIKILVKHQKILKAQFQFNEMPEKYFSAKLKKLIEILQPKEQDQINGQKINDDDLVLVFAFKRRTVEYLDKFFQKYRQKLPQNKKKYFQCTGVTGYSVRRVMGVINQGFSYESNPSSKNQEFKIDSNYKKYIEDYRETMKNTTGVTSALQNQLNRFKNASITKFLLQTEEKYASQLRKITQFRKKQKRILISTSVTEEGFDIPGCNKVISFDTPFSMKAYIQIKGRARKKNSIYYIFTSQANYKTMKECKDLYEDTINATYEIAINRIAKKEIKSEERKQKKGYKKISTKGGALLNSNYALQILKIYFTTLAQPNKGYFHFIETPNIMYKCAIKMPESDPSGIPIFFGEALSKKDQALKSAAFNAVKELKKLGLIKDDLRPSKLQQLEDQFELQKYNDLQIIQTDEDYREIFQKYTQFEEEKQLSSNRTFLRMYFKSIRSEQLDFPFINPKFENAIYEFNKKARKFPFQLYQVAFSNTRNHNFMKEYDNSNQIGLLTCFDQNLNNKLFSNFNYRFEDYPNESFALKKISTEIELTLEEFTKLRNAHEFLVAGCDNKEVMYYIEETKTPPQNSSFRTVNQGNSYIFDKKRQFYPLLVLLKGKKEGKNQKKYQIDFNKIQKIKHHNELFKKLYLYNNRTKHSKANQKFSENLIQEYESFATNIPGNETITLVQSISSDFLFHKCIIKNRIKYSEEIINETKKNLIKYNLQKREEKFSKIFEHFKSQKNDLIQRDLWRNYEKEKRLAFFDQGGIKQQVSKTDRFYFLKEFVEYPISPQTLFKISLAKRYVYDALGSYTKALSFINIKLHSLFEAKNKKEFNPLYFNHFENIILANGDLIFQHLADNGKSKLLRELGRSYKSKNMAMSFNQSLDKSQFPNLSDISGINDMSKLNQSEMHENSMSLLNMSKKVQIEEAELSSNKRVYLFDCELINKLRIPDVQRVLTSKTYKHQKSENYEQFEFIGDVVLKYLATLQIFCTRPRAVQGEMHIARANIICNANLHRKSIKAQMFRYIMASKNPQLCPPYKLSYDSSKVQKQRYLGKNNQLQSLNIMMVNKASQEQGYQYIAGKVHADVVQALIGAFYYAQRKLQDCQQLLYALDVLRTPSLEIDLASCDSYHYDNLPACYTELQHAIGYSFKHKGLLLQALTHQTFRSTLQTILDDRNMTRLLQTTQNELDKISFLSQNTIDYRTKIKFNETFYQRLEFLGDAVLDLIVVEHLYDKYDRGLDQGTLTQLKQAGVSNKSLGLIAVKFKLHQLTLMDIPELDNLQKEFSKLKASFDQYVAHPEKLQKLQINQIKLLGDVFQGLIGAILIDQNFNYYTTKKIVWKMIGKYIDVFTNMQNVSGSTVKNFLQNNNYTSCRVDKISKEYKDGKFQYGLIDRKHAVIEKCFAFNQKDAWDIITEIIQAKQKGTFKEEDLDESF